MNPKVLKAIWLGSTILGSLASIASSASSEAMTEEKINEMVDKAISEKTKGE